jgi:hypothetical protein
VTLGKNMSVEQKDVIDVIGRDKATGEIVLTISDHLDWSATLDHLYVLQEKLNAYLEFVVSGQLLEGYPEAKEKKIRIQVLFFVAPPPGEAHTFLMAAKQTVEALGYSFTFETPAKTA